MDRKRNTLEVNRFTGEKMPGFSPLQTAIAVIIVVFFIVFYLRRSWFWFWKVTKLFKQFEDVERVTFSTNEEVKELNRKVDDLMAMLENQKSNS